MQTKVVIFIVSVAAFCLLAGGWFVHTEIFGSPTLASGAVSVEVKQGESAPELANRLYGDGVIRYPWLFRQYLRYRHIDTDLKVGVYDIPPPITIARITDALGARGITERVITIIPGWDLRDIADYLVREGFAINTQAVYAVTGEPAKEYAKWVFFGPSVDLIDKKPGGVSIEGYFAPETIRVFVHAPLGEGLLDKFVLQRQDEITPEIKDAVAQSGRTMHEILTMASILEREVQTPGDKAMVADILWRREAQHWALQVDSSVHYAVGKTGDVATTAADRQVDSPWNTYKYKGLPPGPICNPSLESIEAALYPKKNEYWYFLTDGDGVVHYAKTNDEQNMNRAKYLR